VATPADRGETISAAEAQIMGQPESFTAPPPQAERSDGHVVEPPPRVDEERKRKFTIPSAYTILFALIVLTAISTWIIPSGAYEYNPDGEPIPNTYAPIDHHPQRILLDSVKAPINGL
jgi:C4-dicarboxylate anaerobic carrier